MRLASSRSKAKILSKLSSSLKPQKPDTKERTIIVYDSASELYNKLLGKLFWRMYELKKVTS